MKSKNIVILAMVGMLLATDAAVADLSTGLVARYDFDGNADDLSGYGNDGTVHGAALTADRFGNANSAYDFDGVGDYIRVPDAPQLNGMSSLTLSIWVKTVDADHWSEILNKYNHTGDKLDGSYNLGVDIGGQVAFQYNTASKYVIKISNDSLPTDSWHHIAGVYTGTQGRIYIDGNLAALSRNDLDSSGLVNSIADDLLIGSGFNGNLEGFFNGSLDDVRIYNRALSASEGAELNVVPGPGALLLGSIGLSLACWLCQERVGKNPRVKG